MSLNVGELFGSLDLDHSQFDSKLDSAGGGFSKITHAAGVAALGVGVAMAGAAVMAGAEILKIGMGYQDSLNIFQSVSGANSAQMEKVGQVAKQLGNDITLPGVSAAGAATAMTELAKAGLSVEDSMAAAKGVLQLAKAATVDEGTAATMTATALNAFGLSGNQAVHVADLLANAANSSMGEITDMGMAMSQSAAIFASAGISVDDLATSIAMLAQKGILGSDAGTSLKTMLMSLQAPTGAAKDALDELGVSLYNADGSTRDYRDTIEAMSSALAPLTDQQRAQAIETIFGSDAARAANIIFGQSVEEFDKMKLSLEKEGGAAEVAAAKSKGLSGAWEAVKSSAETMAITIYENVAPAIEGGMRRAADALGNFSNKMDDIWSRKDLTITAKLEASWDQFDELLVDLGLSADKAGQVKSSMEVLSRTALGLGHTLAGLGEMFVVLMNLAGVTAETFKDEWNIAAVSILGSLDNIAGGLQALGLISDESAQSVTDALNQAKADHESTSTAIKEYWNNAAKAADSSAQHFKDAGQNFAIAVGDIAGTPTPPTNAISNVGEQISKDFTANLAKINAKQQGQKIMNDLAAGVTAGTPAAKTSADVAIANVTNPVNTLPGVGSAAGSGLTGNLGASIASGTPVATTPAQRLWQTMQTTLAPLAPYGTTVGSQTTANMGSAIGSGSANPITRMKALYDSLVASTAPLPANQAFVGAKAMADLGSSLQSGSAQPINVSKNTADGIQTPLASVDLASVGANIMQGLYDGLSSVSGSVLSLAQSIANQIASTIQSALDLASPSRVMFHIGENIAEGLRLGMLSGRPSVLAAAGGLANGIVAGGGGSGSVSRANTGTNTLGGGINIEARVIVEHPALEFLKDFIHVELSDVAASADSLSGATVSGYRLRPI